LGFWVVAEAALSRQMPEIQIDNIHPQKAGFR
jgi:hypothetical protein